MKGKTSDILLGINYLRSCTRVEVFKYIRKLHKIVRRQDRRLRRYKTKLKFLGTIKPPEDEDKEGKTEEEGAAKEAKAKTFLEEIKEAAESAQNETDFIYEPTSGLYYDQKTGYYYNAEYGLYYDGSTGCYYRYNQEKNEFEFHSQVQAQPANNDQVSASHYLNNLFEQFSTLNISQMRANAIGKFTFPARNENTHPFIFQARITHETTESIENGGTKRKRRKKKAKVSDKTEDRLSDNAKISEKDIEDGEITSSSESGSEYDDEAVISDLPSYQTQSKYEDIAKKYPPCLRIIVQETNLPKLKVGTLFLITFKGGSLGREGNHDVIVPDVNISKFHLKFTYDETESVYKCIDLGSRNGTILNGKRMSNAKQESEPLSVVHGSVLQLSQTKLLCHIHSGNSTCGHCEPGLIIDQQSTDKVVALSHKAQLKVLQKRYGLENEKYVKAAESNKATDAQYSDRAAVRRDKVGSTNEYEKTDTASTEIAISSNNKGFKMLSKLGWNKGESLGKGQGLLEPIKLVNNEGKTGLGCEVPTISVPLTKKDRIKSESLRKTKERYNKSKPSNIFDDSDDSSSD
ncbi:unnamed protein product [Hermetia illucens]|uniref:Angiogenic factor with G patch and FHA domains 1 n=2 Tax=Hermetia illucens TaxID=343691 RepID=A0A7R8UDS0_HERIL|nr:unnamed protein product [Hermetia illucens]